MHLPRRFASFFGSAAFALLAATSLAPVHLRAGSPPGLPVEAFFAEPDFRSLELSPDGKLLAFLTTLDTGKVGIALKHLDTGIVEPLIHTTDEGIKFFFWKGSDRIVYGGDLGGNESNALRSISISRRKVVELAESYREYISDLANQAGIMDILRNDPNHILIEGNKDIGSYNFTLWLLDVRTGERRLAGSYEPKPDTQDLAVDNNGVIRGRSYFLGDKIVYEVRPEPTGSFTKVAEFPINEPKWGFGEFAADNETLYVTTTDQTNTSALHTFNVRTRQMSPVLFHRSDGEISGILMSWDHRTFYGVSYETDREHYYFVDQGRANLQATIDHYLPGTENIIASRSDDEKVMVIVATSDHNPGIYYVLDLRKPALTAIGKFNHRINPADMRPMESISYQARDGLTIHGYLTRPAGCEGKPAPLIINPHGGPFGARDSWGFNSEVQMLANRGYAVLQINYRGSGGYGYAFEKAGQREWGGKMQDDLTDGVKWAIAQGIADPARVAIYGASYGGYAALAGVTFTPELYRCAINYVGVSDLNLLTKWGYNRSGRGTNLFYREWVGDDKDYKFNHSPLNFVDRIRVPTLHAYGYNDPRVEIKHWNRLEAKLKEFNKPYEIIIQENEGHGFHNEAARIDFYKQMDAFLARNMTPRNASAKLGPTQVTELPAKEKSR